MKSLATVLLVSLVLTGRCLIKKIRLSDTQRVHLELKNTPIFNKLLQICPGTILQLVESIFKVYLLLINWYGQLPHQGSDLICHE